jgi:GNAT superfamily N-acetyltransferase
MFILNVSTQIIMDEVNVDSGYITEFEVEILDERYPDDFEVAGLPKGTSLDAGISGGLVAKVGTVRFDRLNVGLICETGDNIMDVCDADSGAWEGLAASFLSDDTNGLYKETDELENCCTGDVLLILDIALEDPYRGRGVELIIAQRIIHTFGSGCHLAVFYYENQHHEVNWYSEMGFKLGPLPGYMYLNLTRRNPRVVETVDGQDRPLCRFIAKPDSDRAPQEIQVN